jgi:hypothetical protein
MPFVQNREAMVDALRSGRTPPTPKMSTDDLLRVLAMDPSDRLAQGRLKALRTRLSHGTSLRTPDRELIDFMLATEPVDVVPAVHDHPMRLRGAPPKPRALTAGDFEFVRSIKDKPPASVTAAEARLLAELEAVAQSNTERHVIGAVADPVRRHHDRLAEEGPLRARVERASRQVPFHSTAVESRVLPLLVDRMAEEARAELAPELANAPDEVRERALAAAESDAQQQARGALHELWRLSAAERAAERDAAQARLTGLAQGSSPKSTKPPATSPALEDGRERARSQPVPPSAADLLERFPPHPSGIVPGTLSVDSEPQPAA